MTTPTMRTPLNTTRTLGLALAAAAMAACSSEQLAITNPNTPTVESASTDAQAL